jgi:glycerol-3-phosphate acyltransferase PlsY
LDLIIVTLMTFLLASIPFSVIIGRVVFGVDIRQFGDGNPGATNVYRATGSRFWYIVAVLADAGKGTLPVGIAYWTLGWQDMRIVPIALAAIAGHALMPFLGFRGGKAVAITGGVWAGITLWEIPLVIGVMITFWYRSVKESDWAVVLMMLSVLLYLLVVHAARPYLLILWAGNFAILLVKHRASLNHLPTLIPWLPGMRRP